MNRILLAFACIILFIAATATTEARVTRVEIFSRADVLGGKPFGAAGGYEKIIGKVYFKVDPQNPHNQIIVDLDKAPRDANGAVEFSADLYILKPKDESRSSGSLLVEIPNRGGKGILRLINFASTGSLDPTNQTDFGDGFLMRQGLTIVWVGWQFDVRDEKNLMRLYAPVARDGDKTITGLVRSDFVVSQKTYEHPLAHVITGTIGGTEYAVSNPADPANVLTVRDSPLAPRQIIPRSEWAFARDTNGQVEPNDAYVYLKSGFEPGRIYEVIYTAQNPTVVGLGLAAVRDLISYFKYDRAAVAHARRAYALGISQSGRFLRHFLFQGFNADEASRKVFDGMLIHVAGAGRGSFNHRFAQPSRDAQPLSPLFYPTDLFPFADTPQTDPLTGQTTGLLDRARSENALPKIFYTNTSYEYWSRVASLIHTSPDGARDLPLMDNVRIYFFTGLQHFSGAFPPTRGNNLEILGQHPQNPNPISWLWRALIVNMDAWVKSDIAPPPSSYPRLADKTLVPLAQLAFPKIPDLQLPRDAQQAYHIDYGALWSKGIITKQPPVVGAPFPVFVPQVNADGNEIAGVHLPELEVPLATYTGWNLRDPKIGASWARVSFIGSYLPFARTKNERTQRGDSRLSLEERYKSKDEYLQLYKTAISNLIQRRFLLNEDLAAILARGAREWDIAQNGQASP